MKKRRRKRARRESSSRWIFVFSRNIARVCADQRFTPTKTTLASSLHAGTIGERAYVVEHGQRRSIGLDRVLDEAAKPILFFAASPPLR